MTSLSDDPDTLLNEWLGELDNLIGVSVCGGLFGNLMAKHCMH